MILVKRLQQSIFQHAVAVNRFGGASGAGSGLVAMQFLGEAFDVNADTITGAGDQVIPGVSFAFSLARSMYVGYSVRANGKTAGATGNFANLEAYLDGAQTHSVGIWDKANAGFTCVSFFGLLSNSELGAGDHTAEARIRLDTGQTWTNGLSVMDLYLVGA